MHFQREAIKEHEVGNWLVVRRIIGSETGFLPLAGVTERKLVKALGATEAR